MNDDSLDELYEALASNTTLVSPEPPDIYCHNRLNSGWWCSGGARLRPNDFDTVHLNSNGLRHRIYGPAYISCRYKVEEWYKDGELHREGGPARTHNNSRFWYMDGKLHRLDGPAVEDTGRPKEFWIGGQRLSPKEYKKEIARRKRKGLISEDTTTK